jgi:hypothetical protein
VVANANANTNILEMTSCSSLINVLDKISINI